MFVQLDLQYKGSKMLPISQNIELLKNEKKNNKENGS